MNAILSENINWEVQSQSPSYFFGEETRFSPKHMLFSRSDNGNVLSVMSEKYTPMRVNDFIESTNRLSEISEFPLVGFQEFNGGKTLLSILKNPSPQESVQIPIEDYVVVGTSFDGSKPFFVGTSTVLIRCQNAFSRINLLDTVKHTKSSPARREELIKYFMTYVSERKTLDSDFEQMMKVKISEQERVEFAKHMLSLIDEAPELPTRTQNRLQEIDECIVTEMKEMGRNAFSLFQGITRYTTHNFKTRVGVEESFGNLFGQKAYYNNKAYLRCKEYINK